MDRGRFQIHRAVEATSGQQVLVWLLSSGRPIRSAEIERGVRMLNYARHPGLVPVLDAGVHFGEPYLVTPLIEARTLEEVLADGEPIAIPRALELIAQIGAALEHLHARGVCHGTLGPARVLIMPDGRAVLSEVGLLLWSELIAHAERPSMPPPPEPSSSADLEALALIGEVLLSRRPSPRAPIHVPPPTPPALPRPSVPPPLPWDAKTEMMPLAPAIDLGPEPRLIADPASVPALPRPTFPPQDEDLEPPGYLGAHRELARNLARRVAELWLGTAGTRRMLRERVDSVLQRALGKAPQDKMPTAAFTVLDPAELGELRLHPRARASRLRGALGLGLGAIVVFLWLLGWSLRTPTAANPRSASERSATEKVEARSALKTEPAEAKKSPLQTQKQEPKTNLELLREGKLRK